MELLTPELVKAFEQQGYTGDKAPNEVMVIAKYFNPVGAGTWFATEYITAEGLFFGYANLGDPDCAELGYFSLDELQSLKLPFGLGIERDLHFGAHTLQEIIDKQGIL